MFFLIGSAQQPAVENLRETISYLASDRLEGRFTGSEGERLARDFIVQKLKSYGYDVKLQGFDALVGLKPVEYERRFFLFKVPRTYLRFGGRSYRLGEDFLPLSFSDDGKVKAEAVFAGWGISDSTRDEYAGLDVKGKVVVLFRYSHPDSSKYDRFASIPTKLRIAKEKGAAAVIVVNPPDHEDDLRPLKARDVMNSGILALMVKRPVAESLLGRPLDSIYARMLKGEVVSFPTGKVVDMGVKLKKEMAKAYNVVAVLPGKGGRWIGLGAHYDHLGWGGPGSGSLVPDTHAIHHGADDNASGVAAVLEIARLWAKRHPNHSLVFMFWSGEEIGLLGSKYFTEHPLLALDSALVYINYDMVGRMRDSSLSVLGAYSGKGLDSLIARIISARGLKLNLGVGAVGPSDHTSFYLKGVPVAYFFTGPHEDYHKPSDTPDKIRYEGIAQVVSVSGELLDSLMRLRDVEYVKVKEEAPKGGRLKKLRVKLGIIPAYASRTKGVRVEGIVPGKPAEAAGLMVGDVIVAIGGKSIDNIYDYIDALQKYKPGDSTVITVLRGGQLVELTVRFPK
ncbi:MAG: M20/M25/M40 family metallo-hydrolase [Thermotogae bacterium]|nr:M20/M25/M40 family metallo-hydrolase [Thermotogota bacterium]